MVRPPGELVRCQIFKRRIAKNDLPRRRVTVVGAERSIPLRGTRTFCEGPAELQPHILGPAVLREQQILYHGLRRIARRGGIFFADPVLRGRLPAMRIHGGAGAGVRLSAGKIPAVWSGGPALRPWVAVLPCGRTFVGVNPADTSSADAPGGRSVWGAARRLFGPAVPPCSQAFVGLNPADTPSAGAPWRPFRLGAARRLFSPAVPPCGHGWRFCPAARRLSV